MARKTIGILLGCVILTGCGGGGGGGGSSSAGTGSAGSGSGGTPPTPPVLPVSVCTAAVTTNAELGCNLTTTLTGDVTWSLSGAPAGMIIQPASGYIRWTPLKAQISEYSVKAIATATQGGAVTEEDFTVTVTTGTDNPAGIYVATDGSDSAAGTAIAPFKTLQKAADTVTAGGTIFLRGGEYKNEGFGTDFSTRSTSNIVTIRDISGTESARITVRPHGNEYVKLVSDVGGIRIRDANYWTFTGMELVGSRADLDFDTVMENWWVEAGAKISGRGFSTRDADNLIISDCIISDFPAAGFSANGAEFLNVENNILYNNAWWSTGGTHGLTSSSMKTSSADNGALETVFIRGNLGFGNQSIMISHVFSKGFVTLDIDEGNSIHLQNNDETFSGRVRVENNLLAFSGKSGLGLNTIDRANIRNNSFYRNGAAVNTGAISLQTSEPFALEGNLFHPRTDRVTIKDFGRTYANVGANAGIATTLDGSTYSSIQRVTAVFTDPANNDFSPVSTQSTLGVSSADRTRMSTRLAEYGIEIKAPDEVVTEAYIDNIKQEVFDRWPASFSNIELRDRKTRLNYSYAQRCHYPYAPTTTPCP